MNLIIKTYKFISSLILAFLILILGYFLISNSTSFLTTTTFANTNLTGKSFPSLDGKKTIILVNQSAQTALWLIVDNNAPELILQRNGEVFSDVTWSADQTALIFMRSPLGTETEFSSQLWRFDLANKTLTQLNNNKLIDNRLPAPDSTFQQNLKKFQNTPLPPPPYIRVIHHESNTCRDVPVGQIDIIPFEDYIKRVVPNEVPASWPKEALKAQAVAARTYAWHQIIGNAHLEYDVSDWINYQYMCDTTHPNTNQAVDDTQGEYLAHNNVPISAMFSAENSSPTKSSIWVSYLRATDDPVSFGQLRNGHGYGMGQWGAYRWATWHNWPYQAILLHYYHDVILEKAFSQEDISPPNAALFMPWSNHYLNSNYLWFRANTSDDSDTITQTTIYLSNTLTLEPLVIEPGPANQAGYVLDISTWAEHHLVTNSLTFTIQSIDASAKKSVTSPLIIGLDRVDPIGFYTSTGSGTFSGTLISSTIPLPFDETADVFNMALGDWTWQWEGENFINQLEATIIPETIITDSEALNGLALHLTPEQNLISTWSISNATLPPAHQYRAYFRLKTNDNTLSSEIATLKVINTTDDALLGIRYLNGISFREQNTYQEFHVDFDYQAVKANINPTALIISLQLAFKDVVTVTLDRAVVLEYPISYQPTLPEAYPIANIRLKLIDDANNVSKDFQIIQNIPTPSYWEFYLPFILK